MNYKPEKCIQSFNARHSSAILNSCQKDIDLLSIRDAHGAGVFHYAARGNQILVLKLLWPLLNSELLPRTSFLSTPAHDAAAFGSLNALQWLIKHNRNQLLAKDIDGCNVLHLSARYGRVNELRWLLYETGMPALERSNNGAMALHYAAARGCLDCVKLLVETSELSANTQMDNDVTPVYLAAQEGHLEVLKYLVLEAGGSLYVRAKDGMAPVHAAAQMGCLTCLKWMVQDQGVDPNLRDVDGATPLHFAASRGHVDTVRWLLRHGGRLTLDKYGKSPINDAAENQQMECLNILVQHGTIPDYHEDNDNGKIIGCTCRKGDHQKCSYSDCVNLSSPRAPFYLHGPTRSDCPTHEGPYINSAAHQHGGGHNRNESFFLHNPQEIVYNRVKDLFEGQIKSETSSENELIVKAEVHSSSSGAGSEENLSSSDMSERSEEQEHDYEDIYHLREVSVNNKNSLRSCSRDSGSHSRSGSISSTNSGGGIVVKLMAQDQPSITPSTESGVSSASPSDLGHSEEETEKTKISVKYPVQHPYNRQLKRVISEPVACPPPPPPPLPNAEDLDKINNTLPKRSPTIDSVDGNDRDKIQNGKSTDWDKNHDSGTKQIVGGEDIGDCDGSTAVPCLVNRQLVLPSFIPPKFSVNGENCLIKPSEYLKSIGGNRTVAFSGSANSAPPEKNLTKVEEQKLIKSEDNKATVTNGPPPPPLPCTLEKEVVKPKGSETESSRIKKPQQPLSAISIHDLHSVQLKRTVVHKTMSSPMKSNAGNEPFQAQKQDLIAELKMSRDIEGVKKLKVERLKSEEKQEKEMVSEITKQFTANNLLEKIPEKDSTGNPIPPWKRQMLAKKAAEKARKDLEEQMKREAEEKRIQSIPAWKRQLLAKKEESESRSSLYVPKVLEDKKTPPVLITINDKDSSSHVSDIPEENNKENNKPEGKENGHAIEEEEDTQIIPWRAQLRKTNSKLSLLD